MLCEPFLSIMALQAYKQVGIELVYRLHRSLASRHDGKRSFTGCIERVLEEKLRKKQQHMSKPNSAQFHKYLPVQWYFLWDPQITFIDSAC